MPEETRTNVISWHYFTDKHTKTFMDYIGDYYAPLNELIRQQEEAEGKKVDVAKFTAQA